MRGYFIVRTDADIKGCYAYPASALAKADEVPGARVENWDKDELVHITSSDIKRLSDEQIKAEFERMRAYVADLEREFDSRQKVVPFKVV